MGERKIKFRVKEGIGGVEVHHGPYDRRFEPGGPYSATEQEWDLYLRHVESIEVVTDETARGPEEDPV